MTDIKGNALRILDTDPRYLDRKFDILKMGVPPAAINEAVPPKKQCQHGIIGQALCIAGNAAKGAIGVANDAVGGVFD